MPLLKSCFAAGLMLGALAAPAVAQTLYVRPSEPAPTEADRPFLFSISTPRADTPHVTVHVDTGFGEGAFDVANNDRIEQRFGIQASLGRRFTALGRVGIADGRATNVHSSVQGELLYNLVGSRGPGNTLAVGLGMRREVEDVNVLLGRVVAGRVMRQWNLGANLLFEKPYANERDSVDLITSVGVGRQVLPALQVGVEFIGEDLEGFWDKEEAEGGARLLAGPSLRIAPPHGHWQLSAAGGPIVHATQSTLNSDAPRSLGHAGFAVRTSLTYGF